MHSFDSAFSTAFDRIVITAMAYLDQPYSFPSGTAPTGRMLVGSTSVRLVQPVAGATLKMRLMYSGGVLPSGEFNATVVDEGNEETITTLTSNITTPDSNGYNLSYTMTEGIADVDLSRIEFALPNGVWVERWTM